MAIYRHQLLDAATIRQLLPERSPDRLGKRLRQLVDAGYLVRPLQQRKLRRLEGGSWPLAYTLGNRAARHIKDRFSLPVRTDRWASSGERLSPLHIEHTLEQGRLLVQLQTSVRRHAPRLDFEYPDQILTRLRPDLLKGTRLPYRFTTRVDWHGWREVEGLIPDGWCAIRYLDAPKNKRSRYLFIELDRGTETIEPSARRLQSRKFWQGNSVLRKLVIYSQGFKNESHTKIFGIPTFQVLFVTTTAVRVKTMIAAYQAHLAQTVSPVRFLFTDQEALAANDGDVLAAPVKDASGSPMALAG